MSMGLLTSSPPSWHPAPLRLRKAVVDASDTWAGGLPDLAMGYSIRRTISVVPLVVGFSSPEEVHECVKVWREILAGHGEEREESEKQAREVFRQADFLDWSWPSP
jgi:D-arabinose 1-dehydrogenase